MAKEYIDEWLPQDTKLYARELADTDEGWFLTEKERVAIRKSSSFDEIHAIAYNAGLRQILKGGRDPALEVLTVEIPSQPYDREHEKARPLTSLLAALKSAAGLVIASTAGSALLQGFDTDPLNARNAALALVTGAGIGLVVSAHDDLKSISTQT